jgi:lipopolysaccharide transport system permease protein/teichoic acid transport system permease protein
MATQPLRLTVGRPRQGPVGTIIETVKSVVQRRRLLLYLTIAEVRKDGGNSLLGNLWLIIDPAVQLAIYYFLVGMVLNRPQPDFALFLFSAILPWRWLTMGVSSATGSVRSTDKVMRQIAFPHIVLPIASLSASSISFIFGLIPLFTLYLAYPDRLTVWVLTFPIIAAVQVLWMLPLAILLSAFNVFFRDIGNFVTHGLRVAFYITPALFTYDKIQAILAPHPPARLLLDLNPMAWILTGYRDIFYEGKAADWGALSGVALASIPFTLLSIYLFRRMAPSFPKVL